ncbi:hypothetical protein D3C80_1748050 [compost metagenome]
MLKNVKRIVCVERQKQPKKWLTNKSHVYWLNKQKTFLVIRLNQRVKCFVEKQVSCSLVAPVVLLPLMLLFLRRQGQVGVM